MRRTALAALCVAAAATVSLTGCLPGDNEADSKKKEPYADLSGGEIAERAVKATRAATSLRIKGEVPDEESGGTVRLDMALDTKGNCAGTVSIKGEGQAELIKTGDTLYMKLDEALVRSQAQGGDGMETDMVVEMLAGKWTKTSTNGADMEELTASCDLGKLLDEFDDVSSNARRGDTTEVGGAPALVLNERDGKDRNTVYVATEGEPYLLRVAVQSDKNPGDVTFTDYNKPVPVEAPKGEVLDLDEFGS